MVSIKHEMAGRLAIVFFVVGMIAVGIVLQALYVQVLEGDVWKAKYRPVSVKDFLVEPNRGDICAEDGRVLSSSLPHYHVRFDCKAVPDSTFRKGVDSLALCLSRFFGDASIKEYRNKLWQGKYGGKQPKRSLLLNRRMVYYE